MAGSTKMHCASEALLGLNPDSAVGSIEKGGLEPFRREVEALLLLSWQRAVAL
jgi:hypothetical protein